MKTRPAAYRSRSPVIARQGHLSTIIDKRSRVALPSALPWKVGMRVYYSLTPTSPPGLVISRLPIRLVQNRLISNRVQRIYQGLVSKRTASIRIKNKTAADVKGIVQVPSGRRLAIDDMRP